MALRYNCPNCASEITVRFLKTGEPSKCRACGHVAPVPDNAADVAIETLTTRPTSATIPIAQKAPPPTPSGAVQGYVQTVTLGDNELSFSRAFWVVAISLGVYQFASFLLALNSGAFQEGFSPDYHIKSQILGIAWTIILTAITMLDIDAQTDGPVDFYGIKLEALKKYAPKALQYFFATGAAVWLMSVALPMRELGLAELPGYGVWITFAAVVIVAPVCEEMVFRGYLYSAMIPQFRRKRERMVINAMLFAAAHVFFVNFLFGATIPYYIFVLGFLLAKLYEDSRSILPCLLLHALNNGLVFALEYFAITGSFSIY